GECLLHQQHLPRALDRGVQAALVMGRQAGVLPGQDAALIGDELLEQVDVLIIQRIDREVDLGLGTNDAGLASAAAAVAVATAGFVGVGFAWHRVYLISRCSVWRRRNGLYFFSSTFSVWSFLLRVVM